MVYNNILEDPTLKNKVFEFERGKIPIIEFYDLAADLDDWEKADFWSIVRGVDPVISNAIQLLRENDIKVGLFCNNGYLTRKFERSCVPDDLSMFDAVVESCRIGYRKSDPESYHIAAKTIGFELDECVLIDDSELNVKGAIREGMHGIHQKGEDSVEAIKQLEKLTGLSLQG
ncbi:Bifunctional epoxide hydrolase 2 [Aphelenchoides bicaudatus]|nr:Bifunctional epoxide hydrolase 2 [Aphelenchoides bicaudatus]